MREIKFRGKRIDTGEWAYGNLIKDKNKYYIITTIGYVSNEKLDFANKYIECFAYEVIPETVEQCTGLKDKNGKEIYEGDIVKLTIRDYMDCSRTELTNEETTTQMVVFEHHTFGLTKRKGIKPFIWILGFDYDIEVIGNNY